MKTIRCTLCSSEFSQEEVDAAYARGVLGCPSCGTPSIPCHIAHDATIKINVHEIRILAIWAENYAASVDDANLDTPGYNPMKKAVSAIVGRIHPQLIAAGIDMPLTLSEEMKEIQKNFPESNPVLIRNGIEQVEEDEEPPKP